MKIEVFLLLSFFNTMVTASPGFFTYIAECTPEFKCSLCQGNCTTSDDCAGNLECYHRDGFESIDYCTGEGGVGDVSGMNVCGIPNEEYFYYERYTDLFPDGRSYYYRYEDVTRECGEEELSVEVMTTNDLTPMENSWQIESSGTSEIIENIPYTPESYYGLRHVCLPSAACHKFTFMDEAGDGLSDDDDINIYSQFFLLVENKFLLGDTAGNHSDLDPEDYYEDDYYRAIAGLSEHYETRVAFFGNCDVVFDSTGLISHLSRTVRAQVGDWCWQFDLFEGGRVIGSRGAHDCVGPITEPRLISRYQKEGGLPNCAKYSRLQNGNGWKGLLNIDIDPSLDVDVRVDKTNYGSTYWIERKWFRIDITVKNL